ncbi:hypothetical protein [Patulibacter sp. SYSU D01012]|uniref:hypothetical protein n=1 Tax=Patulibacter sp. SYSU D01012 TaxID=2817381 RepID=UPI001B3005F8|nr:hypothetical protein [Patulibacter sp. SYSU D01012]
MQHMGDYLLAVARWSITGELPDDEAISGAGGMEVAAPIKFDDGDSRKYVGLFVDAEAKRAGADKPRSVSEVVNGLSWADPRIGDGYAQAEGLPGNGVVVYAPEPDGSDRLGVLYGARLSRGRWGRPSAVELSARWAEEPLPASVEAIRARRNRGEWPT